MRITAYAASRYGSSYYRAYEPLAELVRRGHEVIVEPETIDLRPEALASDVVYIQRYQDGPAQRTVRRLVDAGIPVVWDHDDDVAANPELKQGAMHLQRITTEIQTMVKLAAVVTTTTDHLAEHYRRAGAQRVRVIDNYLPQAYFDTPHSRSNGQLTLGWIAWIDHQRDWNDLNLRPTFEQLLIDLPELVLESVGPIDLQIQNERYVRSRPVHFSELAACVSRFDIGIAPLVDTPFNRGRSNVKLKEYAAAGIPWLASGIGPYLGMGADEGGVLVRDDAWYNAVRELVDHPRQRKKLARKALRWVRTQSLPQNAHRWERVFAEAIERQGMTSS